MDIPTILVADGDPKNLQILRESLEAAGFEVIVASDGLQAWQKISSVVPDLILSEVNLPKLDGFQLLDKLKADPATSAIPLMFLTNRRELQDRVRSLRGGVKDYMIKPLHVKEVLARIRMILRRMERIKEDDTDTTHKLAGRLEEFSPVDLIESFGVERKTGVLTLHNENNRHGEIYFREGAVINASLGNLKAEKAVYQMLPWKHGHFTMVFKDINVADEISVSNLGLLLQGFKRMEERERLFKLLPSPETTFVITDTFRSILQKRELTSEVAKFINLIDGRRDILQIIDENIYDDIKTLERLVKLYQQGFIKPGKAGTTASEEESGFTQTLAEPKFVEHLKLEPDQQKVARAPVVPPPPELPPFRPELRLPPAPPVEPPPVTRPPDAEPLPSHTGAKSDSPFIHGDPFAQDELAPEPPALPHAEHDWQAPNPWEAAGTDQFPPTEPPEIEEEHTPIIEIHEVTDEPPADLEAASAFDHILRTMGRGLSPDAVEPELLPLDLAELMKKPASAPDFVTEDRGPENGDTTKLQIFMPPSLGEGLHAPPEAKTRVEAEPPSAPAPELPLAPIPGEPPPQKKPAPPQRAAAAPPVMEPEIIPEEPASPPLPKPVEAEAGPRAPVAIPVPVPPAKHAAEEQPVSVAAPPEPMPAPTPVPPTVPEVPPPVPPAATPAEPAPVAEAPVPAAAPPVVAPDRAAAPERDSPQLITQNLTRLAQMRPTQRPKLIVIGREGFHISAMVKILLGPGSSLRKMESSVFQHLEIGERRLSAQQPFDIVGVSMEQQFTRLLETVAQDLVCYIMLVEAHRRQDLDYLGYLLNVLKGGHRVPFGVAAIRSKDQKNLSLEALRDLLNTAESDFIQECSPLDPASVASFLAGLASESHLTHWRS